MFAELNAEFGIGEEKLNPGSNGIGIGFKGGLQVVPEGKLLYGVPNSTTVDFDGSKNRLVTSFA